MKMFTEVIKLLFRKYIKRESTGVVIKKFCEKMGIVYIKLAQILSTQNYGNLFTEEDRIELSSICDSCNTIPYQNIKNILELEYNKNINDIFSYIDEEPIGSASISQVHRGILKNGEEVAIKVKRKDITDRIEKDIKLLRRLIHMFGKFVSIKNIIGCDKALELYIKWIYEETDFVHELKNIKTYTDFAESANGQVDGTKDIKLPIIYEDLCTDNVIVMEYIRHSTINNLELNEYNKQKIVTALNSYFSLSVNALLKNKKVIFHGDPHNGNIYIDDDGNIGFLDMGLVFEISGEDEDLLKKFFFGAFLGKYDELYEMISSFGNLNSKNRIKFKEDVKKYCEEVKNKDFTCYFTDMVYICLKYSIAPPNFLFEMTKAFICLNGISNFSDNIVKCKDLLMEQVIEYYINEGINKSISLGTNGIKILPDIFNNMISGRLQSGLAKNVMLLKKITSEAKNTLYVYEEILNLLAQS